MRGIFWTLLFFVGLAALLVWFGPIKRPVAALRLALEEPPKSLPLPVAGISPAALHDTWGAPRGNGRTHQGIDIFAPKGTPVRSTTRGLVFRVTENQLGGNVVLIFGPGRQLHYYAHLDRFGDFKPGELVMPGDIVGFVGNTGNARRTPPHLHYSIYTPAQGAINPFPLLQATIIGLQPYYRGSPVRKDKPCRETKFLARTRIEPQKTRSGMSNSLARLSCSLIIGLTINISSVSPAAEKQKQPSSPDVPISGQENAEIAGLVHRLVNEFRQEHGLPPLTVNPIISAEASEHSADMAQHVGGISHRGFKQRFKNIQRKIPYRAAAENVAVNVGYNNPARAAVESWKQSREHRKNMLGDFNVTGIGIAGDPKGGYYFTQIFVKVP